MMGQATDEAARRAAVRTEEEIQTWLIDRLVALARLPLRSVDTGERFSRYGLDSLSAMHLLADLSQALGRDLPPTLLWEHPTIDALSRYLAGLMGAAAAKGADSPASPEDVSAVQPSAREPIAVIGMACRLPRAPDIEEFWRLLREGVDAITEVPRARWNADALFDRELAAPGKMNTRWGGFLDHVDQFDPLFFGISPREAVHMDPQQRLMLELAWEALEDAGLVAGELKGSRTGVFFGVVWTDYAALAQQAGAAAVAQHTVTGLHHSIVANRVSYVLGLQGPSLALDTACSSSLVAVHLACESLRRGESTLALAGGVNLNIVPESTMQVSKFGGLSPDGRCFTFDARANGYVRGEGGGVVLLKPLSRALADGDPIVCVIRGSAVNNDGASSGLTAPNPSAQVDVLRAALRQAGVDPAAVDYVEAHGTGTLLGDPIEAAALGSVFGAARPAERPLLVGSVKTNIGHLEAASGIAGLIKVALCIKHRELPPSLHFETPNPYIPFNELHLSVQRTISAWPDTDRLATAGVSAFGFGGTNCHVVLQEWPAPQAELLPLSAERPDALRTAAQKLLGHLPPAEARSSVQELCSALALRSSDGDHRLAITARSCRELRQKLQRCVDGEPGPEPTGIAGGPGIASGIAEQGRLGKPVFVFSGQGSQWLGMGRSLLAREPLFRAVLGDCDRLIRRYVGWSLLDELTAGSERARMMDEIDVSCPAIVSIQVALAALWRSWGVEPALVVGHSIGEVAAAHVAGALSLEDAMLVISTQGRLIRRIRGQGAMGLVALPWDEAGEALAGREGRLCRAIHASPDATVLSGEPEALAEVFATLGQRGVFCRQVNVDVAAHSPQVDPLREDLLEALQRVSAHPARVPICSGVTGSTLEGERFDASYWARNLAEPVRFADAMASLIQEGHSVFVEISPHPLLKHAVTSCLNHVGQRGVVLASLRRDDDERAALLDAVGALYASGHPVRWSEICPAAGTGVDALDLMADTPAPASDAAPGSVPDPEPHESWYVLPLSAHCPEALSAHADAYRSLLSRAWPSGARSIRDIAYTAGARRSHHDHRLAAVACSPEGLVASLETFVRGGEMCSGLVHGQAGPRAQRKVVFIFSGQGSQWAGMGRELLAREPVFRAAVERIDALVARRAGFSILRELAAPEDRSRLHGTDVAQPAIFALQAALSTLWASWGIAPDAVVGHSVGEVAAAHVAGVLGLDEAVRLVCARGRVMHQAAGLGKMASVALGAEEAARALRGVRGVEERVCIAAINDPGAVVLSGATATLEEAVARLKQQGVRCRYLPGSHAFHSPQMAPLAGELLEALGAMALDGPKLPLYSTVTGARLSDVELDVAYWARNLREPVRFASAIGAAIDDGYRVFLELGPHPVLSSNVEQCLAARAVEGRAVSTLRRGREERRSLLEALGALYVCGCAVDWERLYPSGGRVVSVPRYPWQRKRYWLDPGPAAHAGPRGAASGHPLLGARLPVATVGAAFEAALSAETAPYLADHRVFDEVVLPGAAVLEMARAAAASRFGHERVSVEDLLLQAPLLLPETGGVRVQVVLSAEAGQDTTVTVCSQALEAAPEHAWTVHAKGRVQPWSEEACWTAVDIGAVQARCQAVVPAADMYAACADAGLAYGPAFQGITALWRGHRETIAQVTLPARELEDAGAYGVHPALLDAALQTLLAALDPWCASAPSAVLPVGVSGFRVWQPGATVAWAHARVQRAAEPGAPVMSGDVALLDALGRPIAEVSGIRLKHADRAALRAAGSQAPLERLYRLSWMEAPQASGEQTPKERWLVVTDGSAVGEALVERLRSSGATCVVVARGPWHVTRDRGAAGASRTFPEALDAALADEPAGAPLQGVVVLWDVTPSPAPAGSPAERADELAVAGLHLVRTLARRALPAGARLWWVTRGAQAVEPGDVSDVAQAPLWGLGRVAMQEHPEFGCTLVDLDPSARTEDMAAALMRELTSADGETQVALRAGRRRVARLVRADAAAGLAIPEAVSYRLEHGRRGLLSELHLAAAERRAPGPGEVEIEVTASGLNFRDVLAALDVYRDEAGPLGNECAGVIAAVGQGVDRLSVGDRVMAIAKGTFQRYVTADARLVAPQPAGMTPAQAATVPVAFLIAWHALHDLGQLQAGERVLIHAAAEGVGMAAVQIAAWLGAEVFATASPPMWPVIEAMGVRHRASSRSPEFAALFRAATQGAGIDVVLNSLAGEHVDAGLSLLSPGGRFLEMGKTDVRSSEVIARDYPGVRYCAFDLWEVGPERIQAMLELLLEGFASGRLRPLPVRTFAISDAEAAFQLMAQARHTGKVALLPAPGPRIMADCSVLITGGLGALGLYTARWLAEEHRVRHLVLAGRRAPDSEGAAAIEALRARGALVTVAQVDVADATAVRSLLASLPRHLPLRGVIHAAGVLDDGMLADQDASRLSAVLSPKVRGAWNLHSETRHMPLDFFVLFSSVASLLGPPGQGSYAAANAFMDALAHLRRAEGLPAQSVNWGPWSGGGMAGKLGEAHKARLARRGIGALPPSEAVALLGRAMSRGETQLGLLSLDARAARLSFAAASDVPPLWRALVAPSPARSPAADAGAYTARLASLPRAARPAAIEAAVRAEVAKVLSLGSPDDISAERPLQEMGLDSLMAVELRNALSARVGQPLPATLVFDCSTVAALARYLLEKALPEPTTGAAPPPPAVRAADNEPIAIVGLGCRFPGGVRDPEGFWRLLDEGVDAIREVPKDRWDVDAYYDPDPDAVGKMYTRSGGFLSEVDQFDPGFFRISPREAARMDPQQRLLLETSWEALERAGLPQQRLMGSDTGVFVGLMYHDYGVLTSGAPEQLDGYVAIGCAASVASGRISYLLGLRGPAMTVDTACSSSLVAVHLACQSLRARECSLALAGGATLVLLPDIFVEFSRLRALAPDGRCKPFDASADGVAWSEGCGIVVLKRLSDAERDGDPVLAVIRGSAVNQDGRSNGLTAPNGPAQEEVIRRALAQAAVAPSAVGYVEAHGTGTPLGDPIELLALGRALSAGRTPDRPVVVSSVKSNIGHTQAAAGVAGVIKAVLALQHQRIPRMVHFTTPSPHVAWQELPLQVAAESVPWPATGAPRIAGVSSFGISGTNAHVVLEEAPRSAAASPTATRAVTLLPISARSPEALAAMARDYRACLAQATSEAPATLHDVAYTASVRRSHHEHRLALLGSSWEELVTSLDAFLSGEPRASVMQGQAAPGNRQPRVVFVLAGQGSQWAGMGRELLAEEPVFRAVLERCEPLVQRHGGFSLIDELAATEATSRLDETFVAQPALFALQVALAELWSAWGVTPDAVIGHSVGEVAAAHLAGILSLDDAVRLVVSRGRVMQRATGLGRMAAVALPAEEAARALRGVEDQVSVAAVNDPGSVVLSGDGAALRRVVKRLAQRKVHCRMLRVNYAFHSPQMAPFQQELLSAVGALEPRRPERPMYSTVTGARVDGELDLQHWADNIRAPVEFARAVEASIADGHDVFLEVGPHPVLSVHLRACLSSRAEQGHVLASLQRGQEERRSLLRSLGALYATGQPVAWERLYPAGGRCVALPTYPWQQQRCWFEWGSPGGSAPVRPRSAGSRDEGHPLLGAPLPESEHPETRSWEQTLSAGALPYLSDHRLHGEAVLPGAAYVEMALSAAAGAGRAGTPALEHVRFERMLVIPQKGGRTVQVTLAMERHDHASFQILSREACGASWQRHAAGRLRWSDGAAGAHPTKEAPHRIQQRCPRPMRGAEHYQHMKALGLDYGACFQGVQELWVGSGEILGRVRLTDALAGQDGAYQLHPAFLDACLQVLGASLAAEARAPVDGRLVVPVGLRHARVYGRPGQEVWVHARLSAGPAAADGEFTGDVDLLEDDGRVVAEVHGLRAQRLARGALPQAAPAGGEAPLFALEWQRKEPLARAPEVRPATGVLLLFTDRGGTGAAVASLLHERGEPCVQVVAGQRYARLAPGSYEIDPAHPGAFHALLRDALGKDLPCRGVVHLWSLDATAAADTTPESLEADLRLGSLSALLLSQALVQRGGRDTPRLFLVTRGAQAAGLESGAASVSQAPLWGLGRTLALEHPELACTNVDLSPVSSPGEARSLLREIELGDREDQIALRADGRFAARLVRTSLASEAGTAVHPALEPARDRPFRLEIQEPGVLERLSLREIPRRRPGQGEVEIEVEAAGVNFLDVLLALGIMPDDTAEASGASPSLGGECAGRVVALGEGVTDLEVGCEVFALAPWSFSSFVTTRRSFVARRPERLSCEQAATIPIAFLTAYYALAYVGRLREGERVLIHAGAGGVGMAAIAWAKHVGAEIFATAGNDEKRNLLRSLGVQHVMSSRSLEFVDEVRRITNGEGIDVVLNSLSGEFIDASFGLLRDHGRFVEIGKRDYYEDRKLGLRPFLRNLSFSLVDLRAMLTQRPELVSSLLEEVVRLFDAGVLGPVPCRSFPIAEAVQAFSTLAQAKHVGKIALTMRDPEVRIAPAFPADRPRIRADGSYLITGGLGGLGLSLAQWLAAQGARHLALVGRRGASAAARAVIAAIEGAGAQVEVIQADVSQYDEVSAVMRELGRRLPPLRGVVHAAAVLDDRRAADLSTESFRNVMKPKALGAWNLHALTRDMPLDFFVLYSSAASLLGAAGQANYAAANAFLDALSHHRCRTGLPAMSINWGPFSEVGLAAADDSRGKRLASRGMRSLTPAEGLEALGRLLARPTAQIGIFELNVRQWLEFYPVAARSPLWAELLKEQDPGAPRSSGALSTRRALEDARPEERVTILEEHLSEQLCRVLYLPASQVDRTTGFSSLGADSLSSLELRNRIEASLGIKLPATLLFMCPNLTSLARHLMEEMGLSVETSGAAAPAGEGDAPRRFTEEVEKLSEDELLALFDDKPAG
ncbi:SDR family NAD(P)-dependent oxidoreductase [Sorangium sp. So ce834]|uniref:SDR family NAD(P)-dependent oxidoreductase n=1 Tax=Sorangium sp. So ce834 TaxID=3133321 RepID=UPI003F63C62F